MSAAFVLDCSVAMTWLFQDEATPDTAKILRRLDAEAALVPAWWFLELANVMVVAERKGRITQRQTTEFVTELSKLNLDVDSESPQRAFEHLLPLCRAHELTSYYAMYLDLAVRRQLPLATLDRSLRKAAQKLGVKLLGQ